MRCGARSEWLWRRRRPTHIGMSDSLLAYGDWLLGVTQPALVLLDLDETLMSTTLLAEARHSKHPLDLSTVDGFSSIRLHAGVADALERIAPIAAVGIVSSSGRWYVDQLKMAKLEGFEFCVTVTYDDVEQIKPDPAPLLLALEQTGFDANQSVYVGDADVDHLACLAAGIQFIGAGWVDNPTFPSTAVSAGSPQDLVDLVAGARR